ncbi:MAG: radical SAM protein [Pseudomonadota bacterium]
MDLDAIIISETGKHGLTGIIPDRLEIDGRHGSIQLIKNYLEHQGKIVPPINGNGILSWWSAPKLNGLHLFNFLTQKGLRVRLINKYHQDREDFCELLKEGPRAVIISTTFIRSKDALREITDDIRSLAPDIFIIAGGSFVYLSYLMFKRSHEEGYLTQSAKDDLLFFNNEDPSVDFYIISLLGEPILYEALKRLLDNRSLDGIPNTGIFDGKEYIFSRQVDDIPNAETIPIDWGSLPDNIFRYGVVSLQGSRGCPHRCAFCNFVRDRRLLSVKPLSQLIDELKIISSRGVKYVWFVDDNFRLGSKDLNTVCKRFIDEGIGIRWMTMVRADTLKDIDMDLLSHSGCIEVQLGLESADPQILSNMNKRANPTLYREVVRNLLEVGINCSCYFIFGFPGETGETALRTREFIKSIEYPRLKGTLSWSLFPFSLYPMSPIFELEERKKYGLSGYLRDWRHNTMDSNRAMEHVRAGFFELDNSCAVYRGDNLDMLFNLTPFQRRSFLINRHRLTKLSLKRPIEKTDVMSSFSEVLSG